MFRLQLLGTVQVERDGKPVRGFRSRKALALLGYLAMQDQPVPREHLADVFWGDQLETRGRANLSWVLNRISTLLPDCLQADRHTVQFQPRTSYWLDLDAFAELEAQGDVASLAAAMELYRGEFLEGLYLDGCAEFEIVNWRNYVVDYVTWGRMKSWGEYLQAQWRENLGVETTWEVVGAVTWVIQGREPAAHIFQSGWTPDYPDPDACLRANPVRRFTRWQNDTYDRLVEEARRVLDQGERVKLYRQADKILIEGAAIMPIIYSWSHMLIKPWVTKFPASPSDMWFWKDVVIEPH